MSTTTEHPAVLSHPASVGAVRPPSPLRMLRALAVRLRAAFGIDLVTDILDDELTREQEGLDQAHTASTRTEGLVERLQRHWREFMADGQLDPREKRILTQDHRALAQSAHTTTEHLDLLRR